MTQTPTITPISIHGKSYITVCDRVRLCNADEGFSMISQERYSIEKRHFISLTIEVKGKRFIGDAEIAFSDRNPIASGSPIETAQTSALGRALGFAGYGVIESIASADEVVRAEGQRQEPAPPPKPAPANGNGNGNARGKPATSPEVKARLATLYNEALEKRIVADRDEFAVWCSSVLVAEQLLTPADLLHLSHEQLLKIGAFIASEPAPAKEQEEVAA